MISDANTPLYTISTAAGLLEISVHTIRMYEREGLIIPFKKKSNQRLYSHNDIERIECIRNAINKEKISIEGIKRIFSLIPCWSIIDCSKHDREKCKAYNGHSNPCWTYNHKKKFCADKECRNCDVYNNYGNCGAVKDSLKKFIH